METNAIKEIGNEQLFSLSIKFEKMNMNDLLNRGTAFFSSTVSGNGRWNTLIWKEIFIQNIP